MKLKHTKNGNLQITLDASAASGLLSILQESCFMVENAIISEFAHITAHGIWELLEEAGIEPDGGDTVH